MDFKARKKVTSHINCYNILLTCSFSNLLITFFKRNPANWYLYTVFFIHLSNCFFATGFFFLSFFLNWLLHTGIIKLAFSNWLFQTGFFKLVFSYRLFNIRLAFSNWLFQTDFFQTGLSYRLFQAGFFKQAFTKWQSSQSKIIKIGSDFVAHLVH